MFRFIQKRFISVPNNNLPLKSHNVIFQQSKNISISPKLLKHSNDSRVKIGAIACLFGAYLLYNKCGKIDYKFFMENLIPNGAVESISSVTQGTALVRLRPHTESALVAQFVRDNENKWLLLLRTPRVESLESTIRKIESETDHKKAHLWIGHTYLTNVTLVTVFVLLAVLFVYRSYNPAVTSNWIQVLETSGMNSNKVRFKDVVGCDNSKSEVMECVHILKNPKVYKKLGARVPKGVLLEGPPGTGKTLLAKATAGEANVPFISVSGTSFIDKHVGKGSERVKNTFLQAKELSPCILFIDEIDAIGRKRESSNAEYSRTLNQLLIEMDGMNSGDNFLVIAATNRAIILDNALLRPGRFDRKITVEKPDIRGRADLFMLYLDKVKTDLDKTALSKELASLTSDYTGAEVANICNESSILAAREGHPSVEMTHFLSAIDRFKLGAKREGDVISDRERHVVAHRQAGVAVAAWFLQHADPLLKVSIVPRDHSLSQANFLGQEKISHNPDELLDIMCVKLGGPVTENIFFNTSSTNNFEDLHNVTEMAYFQVSQCGFSPKIGHVSFQISSNSGTKPYSEKTAKLIDSEVTELVDKAWNRTKEMLVERRDLIVSLAEKLLQKDTLDRNDLETILGKRPFPEKTKYEDFVTSEE